MILPPASSLSKSFKELRTSIGHSPACSSMHFFKSSNMPFSALTSFIVSVKSQPGLAVLNSSTRFSILSKLDTMSAMTARTAVMVAMISIFGGIEEDVCREVDCSILSC